MGNFWKSTKFNTLILSCTIGVFTLSTIVPIQAVPQNPNGINFNEIGFSLRIEKLIEKLNKYSDLNFIFHKYSITAKNEKSIALAKFFSFSKFT